ncbi:helix-turn-helix domain-containing protein [Streptomyces sp. NPDC018057]|uniref:XRE family transcriptional regulator n=1 Tax=unclassified Streptomyces TaxID=2593676 RepID=UPI0037891E76
MPRWKALPEELDPQVKEFAGQLRRLVDRSGLSVAALADRTGYSKTSWERYLGGRLLAPKGAVIALAEVTGTDPVHLTTMWELAERAWSRAELRHDRTMEAIRVAQARAALEEPPGPPAPEAGDGPDRGSGKGTTAQSPAVRTATAATRLPTPGIAGPAGVSPTVPPQPTASDADAREDARSGVRTGTGTAAKKPRDQKEQKEEKGQEERKGRKEEKGPKVNSWGLAGYRGPAPMGVRPAGGAAAVPTAAGGASGPVRRPDSATPGSGTPAVVPPGLPGSPGQPGLPGSPGAATGPAGAANAVPPRPAPAAPASGGGVRRQLAMFLAGMLTTLAVIGGVLYFTGGDDGEKTAGADRSPAPTATTRPSPPPGVKCVADGCTGKDAQAMGCSSGGLGTTDRSVTIGNALVEVRYSKTCGAAWGRVVRAEQGDEIRITVGAHTERDTVPAAGGGIAYTPMVAVADATGARACVTLSSGQKGCTE